MTMAKNEMRQQIEERVNQGLPGRWYPVCKSVEVRKDRPYAGQLLGKKIVLWRGAEGHINAIEDYCPHRGAPLSLGEIHDGHIGCRYHGIVMNGEGEIVQVPAMPECALEGRKTNDTYAVHELMDAVFVYMPSADQPEPVPFDTPEELVSAEWTGFLCTATWKANYRLALDNLADPMHGCYLHASSFTLAFGAKQDLVRLEDRDTGFFVSRVGQVGENFDWVEMVVSDAHAYCRLDIPYPPAAGPGGNMRIIGFVAPLDANTCKVFFWRIRKVSGLEREAWRFLYRANLEPRHWHVLEQDRVMLEGMTIDAGRRDMLYQHDLGVTRMRQMLLGAAKRQLEFEQAALQAAE
jgi:phenylpropionate dioxygenase-like ring-hydroxylating dioxygenase large terminal subunit